MYTLVLASSSKNRKELLSKVVSSFEVETPVCNEDKIQDASSLILTQKRAFAKMESVAQKYDDGKNIIIGADTLIDVSGVIFGKPKTQEEAKIMISSYSNSSHLVISSIALLNTETKKMEQASSISKVFFKKLEKWEIEEYLKTNDWKDVAGGYKIQGIASLFIEKIEGSYSGVVGFPLYEFYSCLKSLCGNVFSLIFQPSSSVVT